MLSTEIGGFIPAPDILLREEGAGVVAALIYGIIIRSCQGKRSYGVCTVSQQHMAKMLGMSRTTIWRKLCWLEEHGYITRVRDTERIGDTVAWRPTGKLQFRVLVAIENSEGDVAN